MLELLRVTFESGTSTVEEAAVRRRGARGAQRRSARRRRPRPPAAGHRRHRALPAAATRRRARARLPIVVLSGGDRAELEHAKRGRSGRGRPQALQPARAARRRRARSRVATGGCPRVRAASSRGGASPPLRARPPHLIEVERAQRLADHERLQGDGLGARGRARVEGSRQRAALAPGPRVRGGLLERSTRARSSATPGSSTASSSTTSGRSASPTRSSASPGRSRAPSGGGCRRTR